MAFIPPAYSGDIRGIVRSDSGVPLAGAFLSAHPLSVAEDPELRGGIAAADKDGSFRIQGLRAGAYSICVTAPGTDFLNPCQWAARRPVARIEKADGAAELAISLERGHWLEIRVDDPEKLAPTPANRKSDVAVSIGVTTSEGFFHSASLDSSDRRGHNYRLLVPFRRNLKLSAAAQNLKLVNSQGVEVDPRGGASLRGSPEAPIQSIRLRVTALSSARER
jgi:hypothetical protein